MISSVHCPLSAHQQQRLMLEGQTKSVTFFFMISSVRCLSLSSSLIVLSLSHCEDLRDSRQQQQPAIAVVDRHHQHFIDSGKPPSTNIPSKSKSSKAKAKAKANPNAIANASVNVCPCGAPVPSFLFSEQNEERNGSVEGY